MEGNRGSQHAVGLRIYLPATLNRRLPTEGAYLLLLVLKSLGPLSQAWGTVREGDLAQVEHEGDRHLN